uniref:phenylalanine 4-monooxygenase n=1 Tax=Chromera velia CCMP2878 TaxID=1169474 RepID=A0A0G4HQZ4_9ALVE|mmetsp:Transcript_3137/g.6486  ORF Transcript_3137/g.6486 Transcript_3137/m.6486 type:complete len:476 (-) Transcript_3137:787-2214(-)|eukprot:Cvel_8003.t1-p1 / transcript=Cvel_8003.t1 / gene=Cvel_8003 / organism=Chromera_velia_CCMP2878 / gene_product=Phenylalanine-4-hydroxylase, putative / transcript_product=Phenylalanine-4-hydroxylase, putative / location=Cvel_scaffold431:43562-45632(-) / protein_length=475 / sequence_SO=supercontig / SO=protein_coding / is_pseudo=false
MFRATTRASRLLRARPPFFRQVVPSSCPHPRFFTSLTERLKSLSVETTKRIVGVGFSLEDRKGALLQVLKVFERHDVSLTRIENKPSPLDSSLQLFFVHFEGKWDDDKTTSLLADLNRLTSREVYPLPTVSVPWFPRSLKDIDAFSKSTLDAGTELDSDHPGFSDADYRRRREVIVKNAMEYRGGESIPRVEYTEEENRTWGQVYGQLTQLYPSFACDEFNEAFAKLEKAGIYSPERVPQLEDISQFLQKETGFTLRPVSGLLSGRDFLNALAFRTFFSTQYIRHHSVPLYTPEPDVCHELMGHAPMLANKHFADFSQIIGLASLGASDEQIKRLATCYWFSVEFGVLFQKGKLKAYGAGLLSSFGELQWATSPTNDKVEVRHWEPSAAATQEYPITSYQPVYFAAESLEEAKERMLEYCNAIPKPFALCYDSAKKEVTTDVEVVARPVSVKFHPPSTSAKPPHNPSPSTQGGGA